MKTHKKAKENITANENKYRFLFESNRDSVTIFRIGSDGKPSNFVEANPATTELFGYTQKELLSMSINNFETMFEKDKKPKLKDFLSNGKHDFETIVKDKKGNIRNVEIKTILIHYEGEPAVMNITRDITECKKIEENTKKTQANLTTILEAIPDLLFEVGIDGKIYHYQADRKSVV